MQPTSLNLISHFEICHQTRRGASRACRDWRRPPFRVIARLAMTMPSGHSGGVHQPRVQLKEAREATGGVVLTERKLRLRLLKNQRMRAAI
ncbi:hypothetical protein BDQ94DRAFT_149191 [Aspergillus welwitschiae]|uniref:Uncharacterized protein n=1 Tax=Aspergillus welwitschiae TaxID=1341132 RepID=A0A3F3PTI5_9EURO|nr:hypothetical protein BDQ94DRAFT_149191 [Aspergillus welwitschiae]RDH30203.1 hypothetical protein BDQ94DRAFT_149191 [Aspergillus welwitschiae]